MKRRNFLKGLLAAPVVAPVLAKGIEERGVMLTANAHPQGDNLLTPDEAADLSWKTLEDAYVEYHGDAFFGSSDIHSKELAAEYQRIKRIVDSAQ